jgi:transposase
VFPPIAGGLHCGGTRLAAGMRKKACSLFHVVQPAVKGHRGCAAAGRPRQARARGRVGDPEYGIKNLLTRNLEHLTAAPFDKVIATVEADAAGQEIAAAWIAKEKLRDALSLRARVTGSVPCERAVRGRLFAFCDWCAQNEDIPEIMSLARTIARWEDQIVCAVLTRVTNATAESLNRLAKLEVRQAYDFRNPANQRRRIRTACTRGRSSARARAKSGSRLVTGPLPDPG